MQYSIHMLPQLRDLFLQSVTEKCRFLRQINVDQKDRTDRTVRYHIKSNLARTSLQQPHPHSLGVHFCDVTSVLSVADKATDLHTALGMHRAVDCW
jgi:hypothetical protein